MDGSELIKKLAANTELFRTKMTAAGFNIIVSRRSSVLGLSSCRRFSQVSVGDGRIGPHSAHSSSSTLNPGSMDYFKIIFPYKMSI